MGIYTTFAKTIENKSSIPSTLQMMDALHPEIMAVLNEVSKCLDVAIIESYRSHDRQMELFNDGLSRHVFPMSKHNILPCLAIDLLPYPIDRDDFIRMAYLAGHMLQAAKSLGIKLEWGADRDGDHIFRRHKINVYDWMHYEIYTTATQPPIQ